MLTACSWFCYVPPMATTLWDVIKERGGLRAVARSSGLDATHLSRVSRALAEPTKHIHKRLRAIEPRYDAGATVIRWLELESELKEGGQDGS